MEGTSAPFAANADTESISELFTTCLSKIAVKASVSVRSPSKVASSILSNAALVGANTVKVAEVSLSVVTKSAAVRAVTRVEKSSLDAAISTIVCVGSPFAAGTVITWSTTWITPLSAITSARETADLFTNSVLFARESAVSAPFAISTLFASDWATVKAPSCRTSLP